MSAAAIAVIVVIVVVVLVAAAMTMARRRRLQRRFGPEYDRVVAEKQNQRKAEAELAGRERRVQRLEIRPLPPASRAAYAGDWTVIQERFVDQPRQAVTEAQRLVVTVMNERGYPTDDPAQIMADLSVEHAGTLDSYRKAQEISQNASAASTEDLRQAMVHYRALFSELLGRPGKPEPAAADDNPPAAGAPADEAQAGASDNPLADRVPAGRTRRPGDPTGEEVAP
jgi:Tfp pilus assembly protein PilX